MSAAMLSSGLPYFQTILDMLDQLTYHRYTIVAALAVFVWDLVIAAGDEIECVWLSNDWSFKLFWALLRYLPIVGFALSASLTSSHVAGNASLGLAIGLAASAIIGLALILTHVAFVIRSYALYGRDRRLLMVLVPLVLGEAALLFYIIGRTVPGFNAHELVSEGAGPPKVPEFPGKKWALVYWTYQVSYDAIIFGLTVYKSIVFRRANLSNTPLLHVLIRDGCGFFGAMIFVYAFCIVLEVFATVKIRSALSVIVSVIPMLLSQRLILNLRHVPHDQRPEQGTFDDLTRPEVYRETMVQGERSDNKYGFTRFTTATLTTDWMG